MVFYRDRFSNFPITLRGKTIDQKKKNPPKEKWIFTSSTLFRKIMDLKLDITRLVGLVRPNIYRIHIFVNMFIILIDLFWNWTKNRMKVSVYLRHIYDINIYIDSPNTTVFFKIIIYILYTNIHTYIYIS